MLKKFICIFVLMFVSNIALADTLKFAQITDVHTSDTDVTYSGRNLSKNQINLQNAVSAINADDSIQYVFFTGDSVDKSQKKLYEKFFQNANKLNKPYYMAFGNHDVNYGNELNKKQALEIIKQNSYAHQDSNNYAVELNKDFVALMLDGTMESEVSAQGYYSKETLNWLKKTLKENKNKNVIVFQHFAVVPPAKESNYSHKHNIINKNELVRVLKKYNNVVVVSSGHYHVKGEFDKYGMKHYSTPALFLTPSYYRITQIDYNGNHINKINSELKLND